MQARAGPNRQTTRPVDTVPASPDEVVLGGARVARKRGRWAGRDVLAGHAGRGPDPASRADGGARCGAVYSASMNQAGAVPELAEPGDLPGLVVTFAAAFADDAMIR